jgi:hypothetical protein
MVLLRPPPPLSTAGFWKDIYRRREQLILPPRIFGFYFNFFRVLYSTLFHLPPAKIPLCRRMLGSNPWPLRLRHWHAVIRSNDSSRNDGIKLAGIRMIFPYIRTYFVYNSQISSKMYREGCNNCRNLPTTEVELN